MHENGNERSWEILRWGKGKFNVLLQTNTLKSLLFQNLHYYVNIIAEKGRRVDDLIEATKKQQHRLSASIIETTEDFFDFDSSTDTENLSYVIIDEDKLKSPLQEDIIKSAFDREFNPSPRNSLTTPNIVQKPPRSARPRPRSASRTRSSGGPFQAPNRNNSLNWIFFVVFFLEMKIV